MFNAAILIVWGDLPSTQAWCHDTSEAARDA